MLNTAEVFWLETAFRCLNHSERVLVLMYVADQPEGCPATDVHREFIAIKPQSVDRVLNDLVGTGWLDVTAGRYQVGHKVTDYWAQLLAVLGRMPDAAPAIGWPLLLEDMQVLGWELATLQEEGQANPQGARPGEFTQVGALFRVLLNGRDMANVVVALNESHIDMRFDHKAAAELLLHAEVAE